jgi:choline kinase
MSNLTSSQSPGQGPPESDAAHPHQPHHLNHLSQRLLAQVSEWLEYERTKKSNRKHRRAHYGHHKAAPADEDPEASSSKVSATPEHANKHNRSYSIDSQSSEASLDRLQRIIDDSMSALGLNSLPHYSPRLHSRRSQKKRSRIRSFMMVMFLCPSVMLGWITPRL